MGFTIVAKPNYDQSGGDPANRSQGIAKDDQGHFGWVQGPDAGVFNPFPMSPPNEGDGYFYYYDFNVPNASYDGDTKNLSIITDAFYQCGGGASTSFIASDGKCYWKDISSDHRPDKAEALRSWVMTMAIAQVNPPVMAYLQAMSGGKK